MTGPLRHVLLVNDPARAEALAADVRSGGFEPRIDTHDGGWTWIVAAVGTEADAAWFAAAATRHGAEYEGAEPAAP